MMGKLLTYSALVSFWLLAEAYGLYRRLNYGYAHIQHHPQPRRSVRYD